MNRARAETILPPLVGGLLILVALIGLIGTAIKNPQPHDIKVGLVAPPTALQHFPPAFANGSGPFRFTIYASEDAARAAIERPAPEFGQHTEEILLENGFDWNEIERLRRSGAIGPRADGAQPPEAAVI